jgi:hypothetical protein
MSTTIWKFPLKIVDDQPIEVPVGAKLLYAQIQFGECCLWALCDPSAPRETRRIAIYRTGHEIPNDPGEYLATFQMRDGELVFHVFEAPKAPQ